MLGFPEAVSQESYCPGGNRFGSGTLSRGQTHDPLRYAHFGVFNIIEIHNTIDIPHTITY